MAGEEGGGKASSTFCLTDHGTLCGQTHPKTLRLELLVPNLGSTWPLSSSLLSVHSDCKVTDDWQSFTVTSHSHNCLCEVETLCYVLFAGKVSVQRYWLYCPLHMHLSCFIPGCLFLSLCHPSSQSCVDTTVC